MPVVINDISVSANGGEQSSNGAALAGIQSASVVDNKDPDKKGRVKVSFHFDADNTGSSWARVVQFMAGSQYGSYFLPEVGDEVLVAFENNNHNNPIVIGCLYNGKSKQDTSYEDNNYTKNIKTKAGNEINFSDKPGEEQVLIISKTAGDNQILLTLKDDGKITIQSKGKIEITAPEIDLSANKKFNIKGGEVNIKGSQIVLESDGDVTIKGQGNVDAKATGKINIQATQDAAITGMNVTATAQVGFTAKGNATAELSASGQTTVKGGIVMIN